MSRGVRLVSPLSIFAGLWRHRALAYQMARREVVGRYRGSVMGLLWSFFHPVLMLAVYSFIFGEIFKARWRDGTGGHGEFAQILFAGLIVYTLFAECLTKAPSLIVGNVNFVKKVVFPLDVLPWVALGSSLFHFAMSLLVLFAFSLVVAGTVPWTAVLLPLVLLPLLLVTIGCAWFLASLGVFLRDVAQTIGILMSVMLFLSPIFYPVSALPEAVRPLWHLNPLTFIIEQARAVLIWGELPDWRGLALYALAGWAVAWLGLAWFERTRPGFADVL